ncbi:MAG: class I SAM-dependent methyltransferase [Acidobacteriaceae bacterium]|nr:class I SAM-dependent methyltransferase [Acidobacteriaceae bacterium]
MTNPWQQVPLADYEAHMNAAAVDQAAALSALFGEVLALRHPASVAVLGVAGGNGLERIDPQQTQRVVGIDLNPSYLDAVRQRFAHLRGLELHAVDLTNQTLELAPVDLVHAALIFEHAGTERCLDNALALAAPTGALAVVLQLPGEASGNVGGSGVASIQKLADHFTLVEPEAFTQKLAARGLRIIHESRLPVPEGKQFWLGVFMRG